MRNGSTKLIIFCALAASFAQPCFSQEATKANKRLPAALETAGERKLDVVYKQVRGKKLSLDLYYPTNNRDGKFPLILYTHGGGWAAGSRHGVTKGLFKPLFEKLIDRGFCVATVDYRLVKKGSGVVMRDCVIDCKDAARYLARNGDALDLDSTRFFVMGDSAGGQIAQMLLLSTPQSLPGDPSLADANYNIVAGVSWYGPCDFEKVDLFQTSDSSKKADRFGGRILESDADPKDKLPRYREMSPINYLSKDSPPLLMIQGDKDTTIPVKHAWYMQQKAEELGAPVEVLIVRNAGHNWRKVGAEIEPSFHAIVDRSVQFFVEQLSTVSSK
ncbi:Prolyl oligopeptidase family protein [Stieleria neptunia]|uniref:Prolyl oligopeptidase family protein n=1 Tax=Stieleria neptunia TaxID=2527979 RepID=A0A518HJU4_9BACT|nr:alpha/beta hydrolase [Stieleria neptunia]QDV41126.1 Prolyl oligopeptidase family protein [Stieleria neptunia]